MRNFMKINKHMLCTNGGKFDYLKKLENSLADPEGAGWSLDINAILNFILSIMCKWAKCVTLLL